MARPVGQLGRSSVLKMLTCFADKGETMNNITQSIKRARAFQEEGRFFAATDLLLKAFRDAPEEPLVALELGMVLSAAGDSENALSFLLRAHHAVPDNETTVAELVQVLRALNRHDDAAHLLLAGVDAGADAFLIAEKLTP